MKKRPSFLLALFLATLAILTCLPVASARAQSNLIVRIYFAGANRISQDTNSSAFTNEFCSLPARALENQTLDKLSRAPATWYKDKIPVTGGDGSAELRPLLDDFLKSEWLFEMRDAPASPEYALAIHLDGTRSQQWLNNLNNLLEAWTRIATENVPGGWKLKKDLPPNLFRIARAGDWVVIGCGQDELPLSDAWVQNGKIVGDETNWLNLDVDWPRLAQLFPALAKFDFPAIKMQITGSGSNLVANGKLNLSQPLLPLEAWETPTNFIHPPLTSFTAARGFAPWLATQSWVKSLKLSPAPGQLFIWSMGFMPLQTFIIIPVSDATNTLAQLGQDLSTNTNWEKAILSPLGLERTPSLLAFTNVPFVGPEIRALHWPSGDYLFADVFPNSLHGKAPPPEILQPLSQDKLVFYHWEITSKRLADLPQLTQLTLLLTRHRQLQENSAANQWLNFIGPSLGPSMTEVLQTGPSELTFNRTASAGLTAFELVALANWLEAPSFPGCDLSLPPPKPFKPLHRPVKKLATPPVMPPGP